jgi:DNA-directed RNA polymerase subunit M/transcription elongation factor TFIIS
VVPWSGKPLRETLLDLYKTAAPWTEPGAPPLADSDVIYTFWVKSAICTGAGCGKQVPLFSDYVVAAKSPSIRYRPDCECPKCGKKFDWEIEPASLIADPRLMLHSPRNSNGKGSARWTYAHPDGGLFVAQGESDGTQAAVRWGTLEKGQVCCPHCYELVKLRALSRDEKTKKKQKAERKKVPLTVLLCPRSEEVFQWRGELSPETPITSPAGHRFLPACGHVPEKGRFVCPHCGNNEAIIASVRALPEDQLLPMSAYGLQAYAPGCDPANDPVRLEEAVGDLFGNIDDKGEKGDAADDAAAATDTRYTGPFIPPTHNLVWKQSGKYYARHAAPDQALYAQADKWWKENKASLPWPRSKIPDGSNTSQMIKHNYRFWHDMFGCRQLLALSTLLEGIAQEVDVPCQEMLLSAFFSLVEGSNMFARLKKNQNKSESAKGIFSTHVYQPKITPCEDHVWGVKYGKGFVPWFEIIKLGRSWAKQPDDSSYDEAGNLVRRRDGSCAEASGVFSDEINLQARAANLRCGDSRTLADAELNATDFIITDPPYADNVNYAELADFFYVWLRLVLRHRYSMFLPEHTPKQAEIVQHKQRGVSLDDFSQGLQAVFKGGHDRLSSDGLLVFTFHHAEGSAWEGLLAAVMNAGFEIIAIYPIQSEGETSLHLQDNEGISYDLIHVCKKRSPEDIATKRSWAGLRQLVRQRARDEISRIESGRYGGQPLPPPDVRMVLIGKCLEVYSRHYGSVLDWEGKPLPLRAALQDIRVMVEQVVSREAPLPAELETADALSQVWLLALCDKREVSVDSISKLTRGIFEVGDLTGHKPPILRKGRIKGGRTYEVLAPVERLDSLRDQLMAERFEPLELPFDLPARLPDEACLVDVLHFLIANAEQGERLDQLVERFRGQREPLRAALEYLQQRDPNRWGKACEKLLPFYSDTMLAKYFTPTT